MSSNMFLMNRIITVLLGVFSFFVTILLSIVTVFVSLSIVSNIENLSGLGAVIIIYAGGAFGILGYVLCSLILYVRTKHSRKSLALTMAIVPVMAFIVGLICFYCNLSQF